MKENFRQPNNNPGNNEGLLTWPIGKGHFERTPAGIACKIMVRGSYDERTFRNDDVEETIILHEGDERFASNPSLGEDEIEWRQDYDILPDGEPIITEQFCVKDKNLL